MQFCLKVRPKKRLAMTLLSVGNIIYHMGRALLYRLVTLLVFLKATCEVYLRSSVGAHSRLRLGNGVGIIDSDYTGELCLIVDNTADYPCRLFHGDRIAQMLIKKNEDVVFKVVKELKDTKRGSGGMVLPGNNKERG